MLLELNLAGVVSFFPDLLSHAGENLPVFQLLSLRGNDLLFRLEKNDFLGRIHRIHSKGFLSQGIYKRGIQPGTRRQ
jgi:hypothetical protein